MERRLLPQPLLARSTPGIGQHVGALDQQLMRDPADGDNDPVRHVTGGASAASVCILCFNYERFVGRAIDSALAQRGADVEVVVVDDGSTDGSRSVIESYGSRLQLVSKANGGQASAMNAGLAASTAQFVVFLDADDELYPDAVAAALDAFGRIVPGRPVAKVQWRLDVVDADGVPTGATHPPSRWALPTGDISAVVAARRSWVWPPTSGGAYRRAALDDIGPIPESEYRIEADRYLSTLIPFCGPIVSLERPYGSYRIHATNSYARRPLEGERLRRKITQTLADHDRVAQFARARGVAYPHSPLDQLDPAFAAYRLASLVLDPQQHPIPGDRRLALLRRGVRAQLGHPMHPWRRRLGRSAWFVATGLAPGRLAGRFALAGLR